MPHRDYANLAWGWCAITALGNFDHRLGGQLVLWDLHLVIDFPAGSTILIPSALLWHSNVAVRPGEVRRSITSYSAGALFRWIDQGFVTKEQKMQSMTPEEVKAFLASERERFVREGLNVFSTLDELRGHA